jgi:hypothetical protein
VIAVLVAALYGRVSTAYFCSYDDFQETHRAAFEDTADPSRVVTTPHFGSYKYRPLNRGANLVTYWIGNGNPTVFRVRNLVFHLVNVALVYALGWLLFRSMAVAAIGALLFGIHPATNQTIIGAVHTNTMAHAAFLLAVVLAVAASQQDGRRRFTRLAAALGVTWIGLFVYESTIVAFAMVALPIALLSVDAVRRRSALLQTAAVAVGAVVLVGVYLLLRSAFVPQGYEQAARAVPSLFAMVRSAGMYGAALFSPIDVVLANAWLGLPLPSEIVMTGRLLLAVGGLGMVCLATAAVAAHRLGRRVAAVAAAEWMPWLLLAAGIALPLLPVIVFTGHPSETYLYVSVGFCALLVSRLMWGLTSASAAAGWRVPALACAALVAVLLGAATWVRNERVTQCGETAFRILSGVPPSVSDGGAWSVFLANLPSEERSRRYGFYGFRGTDTIGDGSLANDALEAALQLMYGNPLLVGKVIDARTAAADCLTDRDRQICLGVRSDGTVESYRP